MASVHEEINGLNCQMIALVEQLRVFRRKSNVVNKSLVENILKVVEEINEFIDGNPKHAPENSKELDFHCISYVKNVWRCTVCQAVFANCLFQHLSTSRHDKNFKDFNDRHNFVRKSRGQLKPETTLKPEAKLKPETTLKPEATLKPETTLTPEATRKPKATLKPEAEPKQEAEPKPSTSSQADDDGELSSSSSAESLLNLNILSKDIKHSYIDLPADKESIFQSRNSLENYLDLMMTEKDPSMHNEFITRFNNVFPNYMVYMCGPLGFGLQKFFSTQEVFVDTGKTLYEYYPNTLDELKKKVTKITNNLRKQTDWQYVEQDTYEDFPILNIRLPNNRITYVLTFANSLSYYKSRLVKYLLSVHPIVKKTCIVLQKVVIDYGLKTYFDPYVIALIVIHHFQKQDLLPPVNLLQQKVYKVVEVGPWQVNFKNYLTERNKIISKEFLPKVHVNAIKFFLEHVAKKLNLSSRNLMSPFLGNLSFKGLKFEKHFLNNPDLKRYHDFCTITPSSEHLQVDAPLCLQDPIELNRNLTAHISYAILCSFKNALMDALSKVNLAPFG